MAKLSDIPPREYNTPHNEYLPEEARVLSTTELAPGIRHFVLEFVDPARKEAFSFCSGQFMQVSLLGIGEAPISICSPPTIRGTFEICVREAGNLTGALHRLRQGDTLWVRGPYGQGFPLAEMAGRDLIFIGGGIGLAPLRSAIDCAVCLNDEFGELTVLYGARTPELLLFTDEYDTWRQHGRVETIVDEAPPGWQGRTGVITTLFDAVDLKPENTSALICGPPVMFSFVLGRLKELGFADADIFISLERHMRCGVGKCEHCVVESFYTCRQGPVLSIGQIRGISSALR
ncbi:MAG: FAD/NAD(P)-binding protein [Thermoleophilia bacterium]|nr:FAD/NAD(P)-binding protein [Thermoleophilia bacterium]